MKDEIFCFAPLRWCHNGWASNILMVVTPASTTQNIGCSSIHYDTIEDGQNKKSHLLFSKYFLQQKCDICVFFWFFLQASNQVRLDSNLLKRTYQRIKMAPPSATVFDEVQKKVSVLKQCEDYKWIVWSNLPTSFWGFSVLKISIWSQSHFLRLKLLWIKANYISLQRGMFKLYLEGNRNTDMQIIFKLCSWILNEVDVRKCISHRSKRNEIQWVG